MKIDILYKYFNLGQGIKRIARENEISRNTVRKYINEFREQNKELLETKNPDEIIEAMQEPPSYNSKGRRPTVVNEEILKEITSCLENNNEKRKNGLRKLVMTSKDIHEHLLDMKYKLSYPTVCYYVRKMKEVKREAYIKQIYEYGEVCEFDWGDVTLKIAGKNYLFKLAIFTSAKTNTRFALLYKNEDTSAFIDAHAEFFDKFGVYKTMVYDNMRVAVAKFVGRTEKEPTDSLKQLATYYEFGFRFCNVRRGNEKGHVENSVDFIRRKAFSYSNEFADEASAREHLSSIIEKINSDKEFEIEKEYLLPSKPKYSSGIIKNAIVDKLSCICVKQNKYSVPDYLVGKVVQIKIFPQKIVVYCNQKQVANHDRSYKNHDFVLDIMHYRDTLTKKPGALRNSLAFDEMGENLKSIFFEHFVETPRDFVFLLNVVADYGMKKIEKTIENLHKLNIKINYDNIKMSIETKPHIPNIVTDDHIAQKCEEQIELQNSKYFSQEVAI